MILQNHLSRLFFIALLFLFLSGCAASDKRPLAINGVLDLSGWDFEKQGIVHLDGQWEFYWDQLLAPEDFAKATPKKTGYINHPMVWNDYIFDGTKLNKNGYATFRLIIKNNLYNDVYALRLSKILSAYTLWINGRKIVSRGIVAKDHNSEVPLLSRELFTFKPERTDLTLILQVSNHNYNAGGLSTSISFGPESIIQNNENNFNVFVIFVLSSLLFMGIYHFAQFMMRRNDPSHLFLAIYCLLWELNNTFGSPSGWAINFVWPDLPWKFSITVAVAAYYLSCPVLMMLIHSLYPKECSVRVVHFYQALGVGFFLSAIMLPVRIFTGYIQIYHFFTFLLLIYCAIVLIKAISNRREGAVLIFTGFMIVAFSGANDMLNDTYVIQTLYLTPLALLLFIIFQSFALSLRFSKAFVSVEKLSVELKEKNMTLSKMDKLKDDFLSNTSHELRTPLSGIIGITESVLVDGKEDLSKNNAKNLTIVIDSARRLSGLVNDILDFSRLKERGIEIQKKAISIREVAKVVINVTKILSQSKAITIKNNIPENLPYVAGDENRLQQVFYNLIGNAIKFTPEGSIIISAKKVEKMIEISVSDTGIGIEKNKLKDIFLSFEQLDSGTARQFGGTGLGLSITKKLIELHGGSIHVNSEPGKGSVFFVTLPIYSGNDRSGINMTKNILADRGTNINLDHISGLNKTIDLTEIQEPEEGAFKVMIVDDEPINLQVVMNHLSQEGLELIIARDGKAALDHIEKGESPDLVLLDIMMPVLTGYEVCRHLRQQYSVSELPVILLTAKNGISDLVEGFNVGANDYITKPFSREELLVRVKSHLQIKESYATLAENKRLKDELQRRKETEQELRIMQQRMSVFLDNVNEGIIAINENEEITFCNQYCEKLLEYTSESLLGKNFNKLIPQKYEVNSLSDWVFDKNYQRNHTFVLQTSHGKEIEIELMSTSLELEEETLFLLVIGKTDHLKTGDLKGKEIVHTLTLVDELNRNRERMHKLEEAMGSLLPEKLENLPHLQEDMKAIDGVLDKVGRELFNEGSHSNKKKHAVNVMTLAVKYWIETTGLTKTDFAKESNIWKIYTNIDGWERAQTLDKYLDIKKLPKYPRWNKVSASAEFILDACEKESPLRTSLEKALNDFQHSN
ncbi:MAG: ATP-binding protein [Deltaproteobacteria bacterium]|nr:ATP-binding protein [Deltaproteobacteria bacterium]